MNIYKPKGITSHDVIHKLRKALKIKKIGHAGTLDPLAEGVLPVAISYATKLIDFLPEDKEYIADFKFGYTSLSYDAETELEKFSDKTVTLNDVENILPEFFGDITKLPPALQTQLKKVKNETANCKSLKAGFCINYGGKEDILHAVNKLIKSGKQHITAQQISQNLYTSTFPDPDLMIRTSGEQRLSNFQLWQLSYTELYFPKVLWPDFNEKHLIKSLEVFASRKRRFGGN